jgi:hypothetical protein
VAVILTRYGRDEDTVVAGILHDVVEDCVREGWTREMLEDRIVSKFGPQVLESVLAVTKRKFDDDGVELSRDDIRADYLTRLASASDAARWICAADKVHNAGSILADLRRTIDPGNVWDRFGGGRDGSLQWYRDVYNRLREVGFDAPITNELAELVAELEER